MATPITPVTVPATSNGSTTTDLAEKAGISQADVMAASVDPKNAGVNPDALVGSLAMKPAPAIVTSSMASDQAARDKAALAALTASRNNNTSNAPAPTQVWTPDNKNPNGATRNADGSLTTADGWTQTKDGKMIPPAGYDANGQKIGTGTSTTATGQTGDNGTGTGTTGTTANPYTQMIADAAKDSQAQYTDFSSKLDAATAKVDANTAAAIQGIKDSYARQITAQNDVNASLAGSTAMAGMRSGRSRYAPEIQSGIVSKQATDAIQTITDLNSQEQAAIAAAQSAGDAKDLALLQQQVALAQQANSDKMTAIMNLQKIANDDETKAAAKLKATQDAKAVETKNQADARDFALKNGISKPFYVVGNSIVDTGTGELVDPTAMQAQLGLTTEQFNAIDWTDPNNQYIDTSVAARAASTANAANNQYVGATEYQAAGTYNKATQTFTPLAGGTPLTGAKDKPLSASELNTYASMGYTVKPGMTLADLTAQADKNGGSPPPDPDIVAKLVSGDLLLTDAVKGRGAAGQQELTNYIKAATALDPSFSPTVNKTRVAYMTKFNSGAIADNRTNINTALGHLATLKDQAAALDNKSIKGYNTIANWMKKEAGSPQVAVFDQTLTLLSEELAKVYKGGSGSPTNEDVANQKAVLMDSYSPAQINALIDNTATLLSSKLTSMGDTYQKTMGKNYGDTLVDTDKLDELMKAGVDTSKIHDPYFDAGKKIFDKINPGKDYNAAIKEVGYTAMKQYLDQNQGFNAVAPDTNAGGNKTGETDLGNKNVAVNNNGKVTVNGETYDIKSYATDPNHEAAVTSILNKIGKFNQVSDIDSYIKKTAPNSPVTGQMIKDAADKYGVSWEMITAIMQQDSSLGTKGKAVSTLNPGNVGNTDSGATKKYLSWADGVNAVAKNLSWRKTS